MRLIDADEVIETLRYKTDFEHEQGKPEMLFKVDAIEKVKAIPTIDPVKHGRWIDRSQGGRILHMWTESHECSECGEWGSDLYAYCPNCGALMRGGTDHEID